MPRRVLPLARPPAGAVVRHPTAPAQLVDGAQVPFRLKRLVHETVNDEGEVVRAWQTGMFEVDDGGESGWFPID